MKKILFLILVTAISVSAQMSPKLQAKIEQEAKDIEPKLIEWRRYLHQNPELSNRETKTPDGRAARIRAKPAAMDRVGSDAMSGTPHTRPART